MEYDDVLAQIRALNIDLAQSFHIGRPSHWKLGHWPAGDQPQQSSWLP